MSHGNLVSCCLLNHQGRNIDCERINVTHGVNEVVFIFLKQKVGFWFFQSCTESECFIHTMSDFSENTLSESNSKPNKKCSTGFYYDGTHSINGKTYTDFIKVYSELQLFSCMILYEILYKVFSGNVLDLVCLAFKFHYVEPKVKAIEFLNKITRDQRLKYENKCRSHIFPIDK